MMKTALYTLTSPLHDEAAVKTASREFLESLGLDLDYRGDDYADYGLHPLDLIFVRTGGTEALFRQLLPHLRQQSSKPFRLLASGKSNSLAAAMEILSFLNSRGLKGEIIHGPARYVAARITLLANVAVARERLQDSRIGLIGRPSDWLIASGADPTALRTKLGIELIDIPMKELLDAIGTTPVPPLPTPLHDCVKGKETDIKASMPGALQIQDALWSVAAKHNLRGFTLRCFDLLTAVKNTGCLALAQLNAQGITAGCEGDIPALVTMTIARALTGIPGFQANPSTIDPETGEVLFAHCTIPLNMVRYYEYDTHFESGIGVAIKGYMQEGDVTVFKVSGDLTRAFIAEGTLIENGNQTSLCRTQLLIRLNDKRQAAALLTSPIGNHHVIVPGHVGETLRTFMETI